MTTARALPGRDWPGFAAAWDSPRIGGCDAEPVDDAWHAFAASRLCNMRILIHDGRHSHHKSEAIFKSAARALRMAVESDPRMTGVPSTKGTLTT